MTALIPPDPPSDTMQQPAYQRGRHYTDEDFLPLMRGALMLPNFEPIPHWEALRSSIWLYGRTIEQVQSERGNFKVRCKAWVASEPREHKGDAIYYLTCGQGGGYTGEGVVVLIAGYQNGPDSIVTGRFAICKHESVEDPGANHSRGWHPAHCSKCGLDLSVDSGD